MRNILGLALLLGAGAATAQVPPHLASCSELRDGARKAQTDACVLYAPCNTVLPARKTCEEATAFIDRLLGGIESRIGGFFGRKPKQLTAEAVFEANAPQLKLDADWEAQINAMREQMKAAGKELLTGKDSDGEAWVYEGDLRDGKKDGLGTTFWAGGAAYRGKVENGVHSGFGELVANNGNRLIGEFRRNRLNGYALRLEVNGTANRGNFVNGGLNGKGLVAWPSGASYEGEFKDGARHGIGTYRWPTGASYTGSWLNNQQHGIGTYTDAQGNQRVGTYEAGKLVGTATAAPQASVTTSVTATPSTPAPPADPVAAARDGCTSSENSCQKVCAGVGAIGLLSALRGGRSDEASRQLEQCQARCTSEKSACDARVADIERENALKVAAAESEASERRARAEREERAQRLKAEMTDDPPVVGGRGRVQ